MRQALPGAGKARRKCPDCSPQGVRHAKKLTLHETQNKRGVPEEQRRWRGQVNNQVHLGSLGGLHRGNSPTVEPPVMYITPGLNIIPDTE